jgi:hypothetical protein
LGQDEKAEADFATCLKLDPALGKQLQARIEVTKAQRPAKK